MTEERLHHIRSLDNLSCLVEHTSLLKYNENERVEIVDKLPAPVDEFGIPRAGIHVQQIYDAMDTRAYVWTGKVDEHHLCTPKADFTVVRTATEGDIGSSFRGLAQNKIELPRLMHNFGHAVVELPKRPPIDVMRQALFEVGQGKQLMEIINLYMGPEGTVHDDIERAKALCLASLRRQIDRMVEPEVGMMPSLESLSEMDFDTLRTAVSTVRKFGNRRLVHPAIRKSGKSARHPVVVAA
jgi:hypothetical protein